MGVPMYVEISMDRSACFPNLFMLLHRREKSVFCRKRGKARKRVCVCSGEGAYVHTSALTHFVCIYIYVYIYICDDVINIYLRQGLMVVTPTMLDVTLDRVSIRYIFVGIVSKSET
jgi:hypothetical protein